MIINELLNLPDKELRSVLISEEDMKKASYKSIIKAGDYAIRSSIYNEMVSEGLEDSPDFFKELEKNDFYVGKAVNIFKDNSGRKKVVLDSGTSFSVLPYNSQFKLTYERFLDIKKVYQYYKWYPKTITGVLNLLDNTLKKIFTEDRYDIIVEGRSLNDAKKHFATAQYENLKSSRDIDVIIHYPEITISNTTGLTHTMKDIYCIFNFWFSSAGFYRNNFTLTKSTFSTKEILDFDSAYIHSHVNACFPGKAGGFCFGVSPYRDVMEKASGIRFHKQINLQNLFISLESILSWESIEGTPFYYISRVVDKRFKQDTPRSSGLIDVYQEDIDYLYSIMDNFEYTFKSKQGDRTISISIDETIESKLFEYIKEQNVTDDDRICMGRDGVYYKPNKAFEKDIRTFKNLYIGKPVLKFKGKTIRVYIEEGEEEEYVPNAISRSYLKALSNRIGNDFFEYLSIKEI